MLQRAVFAVLKHWKKVNIIFTIKRAELSKLPITLFCVHGNHEERPEYIGSYYKKIWCGGAVSFEPQYSNILFAIDGEIYKFGKKKGIVIGGAYSVDREYRLLAGLPWFQNEQPSEKVKKRVEKELEKIGWKVDYVFRIHVRCYMNQHQKR